MKITTPLDKRTLIVTKEESQEITSDPNATFKIDGNNYYLANSYALGTNLYQLTFISYHPVEVEFEVNE